MGEIPGCPRPQDVPTYAGICIAGSAVAHMSFPDASSMHSGVSVEVSVDVSDAHTHMIPIIHKGPKMGLDTAA
eukprot:9146780-Pyramimonas_sp.AAC.1